METKTVACCWCHREFEVAEVEVVWFPAAGVVKATCREDEAAVRAAWEGRR